jgi:archaemetzincin
MTMKRIVIGIFTTLVWSCNADKQPVIQSEINEESYALHGIDSLHERITIKDYDLSLINYIKSNPNKIDSIRKVVYLLPFGNMKPEVEAIIHSEVAYLKAFLQLDVKVLGKIPYDSIKKLSSVETRMVPNEDYAYYSKKKEGSPNLTEQIQATSFMDVVLKNNKPIDAIAVLGITEHDIYNPDYNFLFGVSLLKDGVGLVSTFRLIDYGSQTKNNIRKVVSKQIVNMFSVPNVKDYKCVLNYHNNYDQLVAGEFNLSPRALEKLKYATELDYQKRSADLKIFWEKEGDSTEIRYYEECLKKIKFL